MAADKLLVDSAEVTQAAAQFKTYMGQMETAYLRMSDAVRTLDSTWNGEASEQFKTSFDNMYNNLKQSSDKMQDAVDEMTKAVEIFDEVENQIKAMAEGLETGTSPF